VVSRVTIIGFEILAPGSRLIQPTARMWRSGSPNWNMIWPL